MEEPCKEELKESSFSDAAKQAAKLNAEQNWEKLESLRDKAISELFQKLESVNIPMQYRQVVEAPPELYNVVDGVVITMLETMKHDRISNPFFTLYSFLSLAEDKDIRPKASPEVQNKVNAIYGLIVRRVCDSLIVRTNYMDGIYEHDPVKNESVRKDLIGRGMIKRGKKESS